MFTKQVLVIDDEQSNRDIVQMSLNRIAKWDVLVAASGQEGLAIAQAKQPDAILLDVIMPGMDGFATFQQIQVSPNLQQIPIIFLTANADLNEKQIVNFLIKRQAARSRVAGVLNKPLQPVDLVHQMRSILNWHDELSILLQDYYKLTNHLRSSVQ
jgi:CheY-like chemotaxis protein